MSQKWHFEFLTQFAIVGETL